MAAVRHSNDNDVTVRANQQPLDNQRDVTAAVTSSTRQKVEYINDVPPVPARDADGGDVDADHDDVADDADADIYRVPNSNEPLQDNVPFGSNVLYQVRISVCDEFISGLRWYA